MLYLSQDNLPDTKSGATPRFLQSPCSLPLQALPASFTLLCLVLSCVFSLSALSSGCSDRCPGFKQHAAVLNGSVTSDSCAAPQDCNPPGSQSVGFPRQEYGGWLPFPSPVDLPGPGIQPTSPALARGFLTTEPPGQPRFSYFPSLSKKRKTEKKQKLAVEEALLISKI